MFNDHFTIYYDGNCFLCRTSMKLVAMTDIVRRIKLVPFQDITHSINNLSLQQFNSEVHMVDSRDKYFSGFDVVRKLTTILIPFMPFAPLMWIPGVDKIGYRIYSFIANIRNNLCWKHC